MWKVAQGFSSPTLPCAANAFKAAENGNSSSIFIWAA